MDNFPFDMLDDISHVPLACDVYARSRREISLKDKRSIQIEDNAEKYSDRR